MTECGSDNFFFIRFVVLTPDTRHLKPLLHRNNLHHRLFIETFGVDINLNQSVGVNHGADKSGFAKYRVRPEPAFFKAELNPDKIGAALPRSDISA
jgi:hypothetical protein